MRRGLAAVLVAVVVLAGCSATGSAPGDAASPTSGSQGGGASTTSTTGSGSKGTIRWTDCGSGFECGTLRVPVDHAKPGGKTLELALIRHPASKPDQRIGSLLMNPGGPGASAIDLVRSWPRAGTIGDRFDLVGFDPRGVGKSTPLDCHSHLQEMYDADPSIDSPADETAILKTSKAFVSECARKYGDLLPYLGTTDVAKDMDAVRQALGEDQISYLGFSYGTSIGQEYARLFPTHVRAMILDGVVDQAPDGPTAAAQQAAGFTTALASYEHHCDTDGCGFGGTKAAEVITEVSDAVERAPIPAPDADRPATPGVLSLALGQALYSEQLWGSLSAALRGARDGDGSKLVALADMYLGRGPDGAYRSGFEIYFAVSCLDDTWPRDPDVLFADAKAAAKTDPIFGEPIVNDYVRCSLWPAKPKPLAPVPATTKGLPPIVVVSTTKDPATPYENGVAVARQIPGAVLVTNEGEGHTVVGQGKPCIDEMAAAYLTDLTVPAAGTTCS